MQEGVDSHIQMLDTWATEHGLKYVILDPITTEEQSFSALREWTASSGESLWSADDGVHLSAGGYRDLVGAIKALTEQMSSDDMADETATPSLRRTAPPRRGLGWT